MGTTVLWVKGWRGWVYRVVGEVVPVSGVEFAPLVSPVEVVAAEVVVTVESGGVIGSVTITVRVEVAKFICESWTVQTTW
jgi:hypothetical protein